MAHEFRKFFDKISKLRTVSLSALKKITARVELLLMDTDVIGIDRYTRQDIREKLQAIQNCSTIIEFREYENGEIRLHNANYCKNAIVCPVCAARVSNQRRALYLPAIERAVDRYVISDEVRKEKNYPWGYTGVYLCTATIKPGKNLEERINHLSESILKFRKMGQKREPGHYSAGEWHKIKAALSNVEIKIGQGSGQWHVHAHFLVFTDEPLDTRLHDSMYYIQIDDKNNPGQKKMIKLSKISYEWYQATGNEDFIFDVKNISYREYVGNIHCESFSQSIMMQSAEVFKYNTKLTEDGNLEGLNDYQYIELLQRRGGRRLFNAIGEFRCDHRNPRSLTTITEREVRKQEYIDKYDSFTYNIYSSEYQPRLYGYSDVLQVNEPVFKNSDDILCKYKDLRKYAFNSVHAKMTGEYRRIRTAEIEKVRSLKYENLKKTGIYNYEEIEENFEKYLDEMKSNYRHNVREFWHDFNNENVHVHIYNNDSKNRKYLILKEEGESTEFVLNQKIIATNMTPEEIELHQKASPDQYMKV
jgi:hypothetical protein